jgi:hypothetical protein
VTIALIIELNRRRNRRAVDAFDFPRPGGIRQARSCRAVDRSLGAIT